MSLHDRVVAVLDDTDPENGVIVTTKDGRVLATRDPAPDGGAYIVVLDVAPPRTPSARLLQATTPPAAAKGA